MLGRTILTALTLSSVLLLGACSNDGGGGSNNGDSSTGHSSGNTGTGSGGSSSSGTTSSSGAASGSDGATASGGSQGSSASASNGAGGAETTASDGGAGASGVEPYANVVAVATSGSSGSYTFNVSFESSDVDCSQFADWWEVLSEDGELIYRRILMHSHTNENGTTDDPSTPDNTTTRPGGPVEVAADETVIVRAHNSVAGYNGKVMRGSADSGFVDAPDIGSDFAADVEGEDPQPGVCEF